MISDRNHHFKFAFSGFALSFKLASPKTHKHAIFLQIPVTLIPLAHHKSCEKQITIRLILCLSRGKAPYN